MHYFFEGESDLCYYRRGRRLQCPLRITLHSLYGRVEQLAATQRNAYSSEFSHTNETTTPGYYSVGRSTWGIRFDNTVSERNGIAYLDFPARDKAHVILNPDATGLGLLDGAITIPSVNNYYHPLN